MKDLMDEKAALSHIDDLDELVRLREENDHLKYEIRQLTRKQTNPDMMAVRFDLLEPEYEIIKDEPGLSPIAHVYWKALLEARDAYQAMDNFHNWFKGDILEATEGAPELTDEELDDAEQNNNSYTARIVKCVGEMKRVQEGLQEAWNILNDWDFGRRGEGLDEDTKRWVNAWKGEVGHEN